MSREHGADDLSLTFDVAVGGGTAGQWPLYFVTCRKHMVALGLSQQS